MKTCCLWLLNWGNMAENRQHGQTKQPVNNKATDLVTDLVRMGYFFRSTRYCCSKRKWMDASRTGRLSTGIVSCCLTVQTSRLRDPQGRSWKGTPPRTSCRRHCVTGGATPSPRRQKQPTKILIFELSIYHFYYITSSLKCIHVEQH